MAIKNIITGPCCAGKTTIINLLKEKGYNTIPESARKIIIEENSKNNNFSLNSEQDFINFQYQVLDKQKQYESNIVRTSKEIHFLDRGAGDSIGYFQNRNIKIPEDFLNKISSFEYSKVFFLELLKPEYYKQDSARKETYEEALNLQKSIFNGYKMLGFNPILISNELSINQRLEFILKNM